MNTKYTHKLVVNSIFDSVCYPPKNSKNNNKQQQQQKQNKNSSEKMIVSGTVSSLAVCVSDVMNKAGM